MHQATAIIILLASVIFMAAAVISLCKGNTDDVGSAALWALGCLLLVLLLV